MLKKISLYQQKLKYYLFEKIIIEYKSNVFKKENREVDQEEIKQFKFHLFIIYSVLLVIPTLLIISFI